MSRFNDFDAARAEREPLRFRLGGELFEIAVVPAGALLAIAAAEASKNTAQQFAAYQQFFESVIAAEDQERFAAAMLRVELSDTLDVIRWLIEEGTGRPFMNAPRSPVTPPESGAPSRVVSLSAVKETRSA